MRSTATYSSWDITKLLDSLGIDVLTGEACGLSMRLLCDANGAGQALLDDFFGGVSLKYEGMNDRYSKVVLLPREVLKPLVVYGLVKQGHLMVELQHTKETYQLMCYPNWEAWRLDREEYGQQWQDMDYSWRAYSADGTAPGGLRNVHAMSGRVL